MDTNGDVIGVATSIVRDGRGIGFAVPAPEVATLLGGKVCSVRAEYFKQPDGKVKVTVEALVSNPHASLTGVKLHYALAESQVEPPKGAAQLVKRTGAVMVPLKLNGSVATGEFVIDRSAGQLFYSAETIGPKETTSTMVVADGLSRALLGQGLTAGEKPPAGWKELSTNNGFITLWVPEKSGKADEASRTVRTGPVMPAPLQPVIPVQPVIPAPPLIPVQPIRPIIPGRPVRPIMPGPIPPAPVRPGPAENGPAFLTIQVTSILGDNGVKYSVEMATMMPPLPIQVDTGKLRDLLAEAEAEILGGKIIDESALKLGTWPCREYLIKSGEKASAVRIMVTPMNIYIHKATGPTKQVQGDDGIVFMNSFRAHPRDPGTTAKKPDGGKTPPRTNENPAPAKPGVETEIAAGGNDPMFKDFGPEKSFLVGFEVTTGPQDKPVEIVGLRPIFRAGETEAFGEQHGPREGAKTIKAKPGFAVGSVTVRRDNRVRGLLVTFMKLDGGKLNPSEKYESEWIGDRTTHESVTLDGKGSPFVAVTGRESPHQTRQLTGLGLTPDSSEAAAIRRAWTAGTPTEVLGVSFDPSTRDIGPADGLLVGLEIGLEKSRQSNVVRSLKPIYRVGETESTGKQFGKDQPETVKLVAKPGYAIGAVNTRIGLTVDGLSVTFMKVVDGKLDSKDKYDSEWVGSERGRTVTISGEGTPVVGLVGREGGFKTCSGFGLLLQKTRPQP